jgi:signal transduction histidine kinase
MRVTRAYAPSLPPIRGDARRLRQAFANLMLNGMEAMPEGGEIRLQTSTCPDGCNRVSIFDDGPGIPEAEIERIFLPFYSTKPQGTGLGLPLVARVIAAHGGRIAVESGEGEGTTIHIDLPPAADTGEPGVRPCRENVSSLSTTTS